MPIAELIHLLRGNEQLILPTTAPRLTLPSPKERVLTKSEVKVLSFGEDYFMRAAPFRWGQIAPASPK
jgi:hypothetical protein